MKKPLTRPTFDCHGLTYLEVEDKFENWLLLNSTKLPLDVITGDSDKMKLMIMGYLNKHKFIYNIPYYNHGMITVIS
jgi:hypothetical protein